MSVHKDLIKHANKQHQTYKQFLALDEERERYIQEAVLLCQQGKSFTTAKINEVTDRINLLAKLRVVPSRKNVTGQMIEEYVNKISSR
ncbi:DUF2533 family protein [Peribacillus glennii]|uniref:DUF2533 family protein n=1 Tax=Peribacillus glennii TaxID=2303991 RepID=A0A372LF68_9BACI|nr:DUF2533 family protein [Peribacillus glennii]RFU64719.1 DUF2533 family protein [Peribacillus glennii]